MDNEKQKKQIVFSILLRVNQASSDPVSERQRECAALFMSNS